MYFAIIDACSDVSRLGTIAYGDNILDIVMWFCDEFKEYYDMYSDDLEESEKEDILNQCEELCEIAKQDGLSMDDLTGLNFGISDVSVEIIGVYDNIADLKIAFERYVSNKPKYKKIVINTDVSDFVCECDRVNTLLIRESI